MNSAEIDQKILLRPYEYLLQISGKHFRVKLINAFNYWLKISEDKVKLIAEVVEMLHEASLLIDDIEDNSDMRRGIPVAHHVFGVPQTINSANYVYFLALQKALSLNHPSVPFIFAEQMLKLHHGQGLELYWRDHHKCPTEEEYVSMATKKTGGLFCLAIRLMQLFSDNENNFESLSENLGLLFQVTDDYANLKCGELKKKKGFADDLSEGKFSFPLIHAINSHPQNDLVSNILRQKTRSEEVKDYCIGLLESYGSFAYTRDFLTKLHQKVLRKIEELNGNEHLLAIVQKWSETFHHDKN